ncbi:hypothetical protein RS85_00934 [Microbacterium sp. SA39]|nr:hypothetical protein RS85_00934 [Microbacterium sp. SA39]
MAPGISFSVRPRRSLRASPASLPAWRNRYRSACSLARFEGEASDLGIVYSAIEVYAYEMELDLTGEFHLIFIEQVDLHVTVDVFASTLASRP